MADGPLRSPLVDGVVAGVGSVLVFLSQILILFAFILLLEDSGYLPRAAFLLVCTGYAAWTMMPQALRRTLAGWFGKPLPAGSGGCDGCGDAKAARSVAADGKPRASVIRIVRRPPS